MAEIIFLIAAHLVSCETELFLKVEIKGTKHRCLCRLETKVVPLLEVLCDEEMPFFFFF